MYLLSHLRLGASLGMVDGLTLAQIGELALLSQPAHLQRLVGADLSPADRGRQRADMIRERLRLCGKALKEHPADGLVIHEAASIEEADTWEDVDSLSA